MSDWKSLAEKELRGRSLTEIEWETLEGIRVKPLCTSKALQLSLRKKRGS